MSRDFHESSSPISNFSENSRGTTGIIDTGSKFATVINDSGGKFSTGVNYTGGKFVINIRMLSPESELEEKKIIYMLTLLPKGKKRLATGVNDTRVVHLELRISP